jgi:hypothetical protein
MLYNLTPIMEIFSEDPQFLKGEFLPQDSAAIAERSLEHIRGVNLVLTILDQAQRQDKALLDLTPPPSRRFALRAPGRVKGQYPFAYDMLTLVPKSTSDKGGRINPTALTAETIFIRVGLAKHGESNRSGLVPNGQIAITFRTPDDQKEYLLNDTDCALITDSNDFKVVNNELVGAVHPQWSEPFDFGIFSTILEDYEPAQRAPAYMPYKKSR